MHVVKYNKQESLKEKAEKKQNKKKRATWQCNSVQRYNNIIIDIIVMLTRRPIKLSTV